MCTWSIMSLVHFKCHLSQVNVVEWFSKGLVKVELLSQFGYDNARMFTYTKGLFRVEAIITIWNHDWVIMIMFFVYMYITSKRIEQESPNCSGFEENFKSHHIGVLIIDQIMISKRDISLHSEQTQSQKTNSFRTAELWSCIICKLA